MNREATLSAALPVFYRYGFRKVTMDDIAREVGVSRQGLYNHFGSKAKLFEEMVSYLADEGVRRVEAALADETTPLDERLLEAFDRWVGQHIDALHASPHAREVAQLACDEAGEQHLDLKNSVLSAVTTALRRAGINKQQHGAKPIAQTLYATSKGLAELAPSRSEYVKNMRTAIGVILPE